MKKINRTAVHFAHNYLINPTNPLTVNLIGAGGTGSHMLTALSKINYSLTQLGHPGLSVNYWDDDIVTSANIGRQLYADAELGLFKAVALINRVNRFFGTNWKAITKRFGRQYKDDAASQASIYISCVDSINARFEIASTLKCLSKAFQHNRDLALYWIDTGNARFTGQAILSTVSAIKQPPSKLYRTTATLPFMTEEFKDLLQNSVEDDLPSCSLADALEKQDLFINPAIADLTGSLLWQLIRNGMTENRGFYLNLEDLSSAAIKVA